jgi:hypothetical protein
MERGRNGAYLQIARRRQMAPVVGAFPDCVTRLRKMLPAIEQRFGYGVTGRGGVLGKGGARR